VSFSAALVLPAVMSVTTPIAVIAAVAVAVVITATPSTTATATATPSASSASVPIAGRVIVAVVRADGGKPEASQHVGSALGSSVHGLSPGVLAQTDHGASSAGFIGDCRAGVQLTAIDRSIEGEDDGRARDRQAGGSARLHHQRLR
jgi:hypothetical protein